MISKRVSMRSAKKSSFSGLVAYITSTQGKQERVDQISITNCDNALGSDNQSDVLTNVIADVCATQALNTRATGDKTYHLLVSFRAGEKPDAGTLKAIEAAFCDALGFAEHQRVSAVHTDTENVHLHVAINKIHPTRHTMHEPRNDYWKRDQLCAALEQKYGLAPDNHAQTRNRSQAQVADMEAHTGEQSLASWIKQTTGKQLLTVSTWDQLTQVLDQHGLSLKKRGNGFVLATEEGAYVKASTVDRKLSKSALEGRLGSYDDWAASRPVPVEPKTKEKSRSRKETYARKPISLKVDTTELYARYTADKAREALQKKRDLEALSHERARRVDAAKGKAAARRATLGLARGKIAKRIAYAGIASTLQADLAAIRQDISGQRQRLSGRKPQSWADWLRAKSLTDATALAAIRARSSAEIKRADRAKNTEVIRTTAGQAQGMRAVVDGITKTGTIIYRTAESAVRDDGETLSVSKRAEDRAIIFAMTEAAQRQGSVLTLSGSLEFQQRAAALAGRNGLAVSFRDSALETIRREENSHVRANENTGRADRRNDGGLSDSPSDGRAPAGSSPPAGAIPSRGPGRNVVRDAAAFRRAIHAAAQEPDLGSLGNFPSAPPANGVRSMSRLPMAFDAARSSVLVPTYARDGVDHQRTNRNSALRRAGNHQSAANEITAESAAKMYVQERADTRLKGFDIPKHQIYSLGAQEMVFEGVRHVRGHSLVLLKEVGGQGIFVLPTDQKTEHRLKQIKRGSQIGISADQKISTVTGRRKKRR